MMLVFLPWFFITCAAAILAPRTQHQIRAPYHLPDGPTATPVQDSYIVLFHTNHSLLHHYENIGVNISEEALGFSHFVHLNGYRAVLKNATTLHELVRRDPGVRLVEHDTTHTLPPRAKVQSSEEAARLLTSKDFPPARNAGKMMGKRWNWVSRPTSDFFWFWKAITASAEPATVLNAGYGVNVYVIDSGVNEHADLVGRVSYMKDMAVTDNSPYCPLQESNVSPPGHESSPRSPSQPRQEPSLTKFADLSEKADVNGHGTACAGIIAGTYSGVAPSANIISVKNVCGSDGIQSNMALTVQALDDIANRESLAKQNVR